jgi:hypothetical protein
MAARKTTTAKKTAAGRKAPAAKEGAAPTNWRVRIRMHRQGVGDCFLLTFRVDGKPVHMLIDCGVLPHSPKEHNRIEAVAAAVRDEVKANGGKLAVLVATHEHADHVSAFEPGKKTAATLDEIPVDEVWTAWTEDPDDTVAQGLNGQLAMHAMAAAAVLPRLKRAAKSHSKQRFGARANQSAGDVADILSNLGLTPRKVGAMPAFTMPSGLAAAGAGPLSARLATTVRAAMDHVKSRVPAGNLKKLKPGEMPVVPGISKSKVRVFVLGPPRIANLDKTPRHGPSDDIFHIAGGDLRAQARDLAAGVRAQSAGADEDASSRPFAEKMDQSRGTASKALKKLRKSYREKPWRGIDDDWLLAGGEFAMQLDSATNNTSLVLAIELVDTGEVLLFPGDAQVENWETWRDVACEVTDIAGRTTTVKGEDLLRRTVFYKVGHHGSHNGTLDVHGLQLMPSGSLVAMCPVIHAVTSKRKGDWKEIPKPSLCTALETKCGDGFLRMDAPKDTLRGRLEGRVQEDVLWVDYFLV